MLTFAIEMETALSFITSRLACSRSRAVGGLSEWRIHSVANQTRDDFTTSSVVAESRPGSENLEPWKQHFLKTMLSGPFRPTKNPTFH